MIKKSKLKRVFYEQDDSGNVVTWNALLMDTRNSIVHTGNKQVVVLGADKQVAVDKLYEEGKTGLLLSRAGGPAFP